MTTRICPVCSGEWMYGLTFRHTNDCALRDLDDGTLAADFDRSMFWPIAYGRPATATEQSLFAALGWPAPIPPADDSVTPPAVTTLVLPISPSIRRRLVIVDGGSVFDPDDPVAVALTTVSASASAMVSA